MDNNSHTAPTLSNNSINKHHSSSSSSNNINSITNNIRAIHKLLVMVDTTNSSNHNNPNNSNNNKGTAHPQSQLLLPNNQHHPNRPRQLVHQRACHQAVIDLIAANAASDPLINNQQIIT